jgi:2-polyprenyl-3-methyl-5-hydroxy-6-metoxy-1,4-benzoquinol methylase
MSDPRYIILGGEAGYKRLQVLARASAPNTTALFDRVGLHDGMRCCDLGCGPGVVSLMLAERVGPSGHVDGIDMDEVKLGLARRDAAERGVANVTFRAGDVTAWEDPGAYDVVYARFLLQHLERPVDMLARMWAGVRPGGALVVEDADFSLAFCEPPLDAFDFFIDAYAETIRRRGGDHTAGRKLHRYALEAGVAAPQLRVVQRVDAAGEAKTMIHRTLLATSDAMVAEGVATREAIAEAAAGLAAATADPGTVIGAPATFQLRARRP